MFAYFEMAIDTNNASRSARNRHGPSTKNDRRNCNRSRETNCGCVFDTNRARDSLYIFG